MGGFVRVRAMTEGDIERAYAIAAALKDAPHWLRASYLAAVSSDSEPHRIALVAEDAEVMGFAVASLLSPLAELESIAVARPEQGRGIGRALMDDLVQRLRDQGAEELLLEVRAANQRAVEFYASLGFARVGLRTAYYQDPLEDAVLMRLALAE